MSADECAVSDWRAIGFEDGSQGYTSDRLGDHRKACAKHGMAPNFDDINQVVVKDCDNTVNPRGDSIRVRMDNAITASAQVI
jgi:hypothetical protein